MRTVAALLLFAAVASADEPHAFVELVADRAEYYVEQPIRLTLRIGYDEEFFEKHAVQLFQQKLDVPVHAEAPDLDRPVVPSGGKTLALNDDVVHARMSEPRGRYTVFVLEQTLLLAEAGDRTFAAPSLRFASGTRFRDDFLHGRVATDRRDTVIHGAPLKLRVLPIPIEGRPKGWAGAVGQLRIRTEVPQRELDEGQTLELRLSILGLGAGQSLPIPVLPDLGLDDFHVVGSLASDRNGTRLVTYTLRPLHPDIDEVPSLAMPYFDPTPPARFRVAKSEPIPISVRAKPKPPATESESRVEEHVIPEWMIFGAAALVLAIALFVWRATRKVEAGPSEAFALFETNAASGLVDAFPAYLAAHLDCPAAAVISPELKARLVKAGVPDELATRTAALVERLVGSRYGGGATGDRSANEAHKLVAALESVFHPRDT